MGYEGGIVVMEGLGWNVEGREKRVEVGHLCYDQGARRHYSPVDEISFGDVFVLVEWED